MAITDRNLVAGIELEGFYKKARQFCVVEASADGKLAFVLEDGRRFKSASAAASAVMGGKAVNGWLFWSLSGEARSEADPAAPQMSRQKRMVYRLPNQKGVAAGKSRWYCGECKQSFVIGAAEEAPTCPAGHRQAETENADPFVAAEGVQAQRD